MPYVVVVFSAFCRTPKKAKRKIKAQDKARKASRSRRCATWSVEQVVAAPLHHRHSTTTFISVLFGSGQLGSCVCVCVCALSDVDVDAEVYKMHNLALPFHQLPFSSCPSARSRSLSPLCVCVSLRLVSSLRLFFIFILAFVFIDSQVVWLFHFSFGRKTFDLHSGLPAPSRPYSNVFFSLPLHLLSLATPIRFLVCCLSLGISG